MYGASWSHDIRSVKKKKSLNITKSNKEKLNTKTKKTKGSGDAMDPKMATLTFVDILIKQYSEKQFLFSYVGINLTL